MGKLESEGTTDIPYESRGWEHLTVPKLFPHLSKLVLDVLPDAIIFTGIELQALSARFLSRGSWVRSPPPSPTKATFVDVGYIPIRTTAM
jgi:hypothetical protein